MYKPPITIYQALRDSLNIQLENNVCKAVASYGINVDKDELIKALKYDREQYEKGYTDGRAECPEWIPCSERLPEDGQTVLIQYVSRNDKEDITIAVGWMGYGSLCSWDDRVSCMDDYVAWMPLPEPYKEEEA